MKRFLRMANIGALTLAACVVGFGQNSGPRRSDPLIRQMALYVLGDIADEVREVENVEARAALTADVVSLLAKKNPERCRRMLDAFFDYVLRQAQASTPDDGEKTTDFNSLVSEIVGMAASFDRKLAESYIDRYLRAEKRADDLTANATDSAGALAAGLYLRLALNLVQEDAPLAVSVAERSLDSGIKAETLLFLAKLRRRDEALAKSFFLSALASVERRAATDVNELFLLQAYSFSSPQVLYMTVHGPAFQQIPEYAPLIGGVPVDAELQKRFLQASVRLLLAAARSQRMGLGQLAVGALGDYYFLKAVEPHLAESFPALLTQVEARELFLAGSLNLEQRPFATTIDRLNDARRETAPPSLDQLMQRAADMADVKEKDRVYFRVMMAAVRENRYDLALEAVEKLSPAVRDVAQPFVRYSVARQLLTNNQLERAEQLVRTDNDAGRRAYLLTLIARALVKGEFKNFGRATELVNEVEQLASKLDDREKAIVLAGLSSVCVDYDTARAAQLLREVIRVADNIKDFTGNGKMLRSFEYNGLTMFYEMYGDDLTMVSSLEQQGRHNFPQILADARIIKGRIFRLRAMIALCRAVLTS